MEKRNLVLVGVKPSSKTLEPIRFELLRRQISTTIVRTPPTVFLCDSDRLVEIHGTNEQRENWFNGRLGDSQETDKAILERMAAAHVQSFGPIGGIVIGEADWIEWGDHKYAYVIDAVSDQYPTADIWVFAGETIQLVQTA